MFGHSAADFVTEEVGHEAPISSHPFSQSDSLSLIRTALLLQPPSNYLIEGIEKIELRCSV